MNLRSIPPMNRQRNTLARLSSMQAATRIGLIFVGASSTASEQSSAESDFKPKMKSPDRMLKVRRAAYAKALEEKLAFWRGELAAWAPEFGPEKMKKLEELVNGR